MVAKQIILVHFEMLPVLAPLPILSYIKTYKCFILSTNKLVNRNKAINRSMAHSSSISTLVFLLLPLLLQFYSGTFNSSTIHTIIYHVFYSCMLYINSWVKIIYDSGKCELQLNYYSESCPRAEEIIKEQVQKLYHIHGNTAVSWIRNLFHDCIVKVNLYHLLLHTTHQIFFTMYFWMTR